MARADTTLVAALLCVWLAGGAVVNIFEYSEIDARENYRAGSGVPSYRNASIPELVRRTTSNAQVALRFYFVLADTVERPSLVVPPGSVLPDQPFLPMAISHVSIADYDPVVSADTLALLEDHFVEESTHSAIGDYAVAVDATSPSMLVEVHHANLTVLADPDLLPEALRHLTGNPDAG